MLNTGLRLSISTPVGHHGGVGGAGWRGESGCTVGVDELAAIVTAADAVVDNASERLIDTGTVFHELVVSAWVADPQRSRALLVHHPRHGRWLPPGGRVDAGESPIAAVVRELREETGIDAAPIGPPALVDVVDHPLPDGTPAFTFGIAYRFEVPRTAPLEAEPGQPVKWWPIDAPPADVAWKHWERQVRHLHSIAERCERPPPA